MYRSRAHTHHTPFAVWAFHNGKERKKQSFRATRRQLDIVRRNVCFLAVSIRAIAGMDNRLFREFVIVRKKSPNVRCSNISTIKYRSIDRSIDSISIHDECNMIWIEALTKSQHGPHIARKSTKWRRWHIPLFHWWKRDAAFNQTFTIGARWNDFCFGRHAAKHFLLMNWHHN